MGGQVVGGGIIVLVAAGLWLVYLVPAWHRRRQFDAAERNAVRLSRALRVLAQTSEAPREVQMELDTRSAAAAQRALRRERAERDRIAQHEQAEREKAARREQTDRERIARDAQTERDRLAKRALIEQERERTLRRDAQLEEARARRAAARRAPWARRARARRRARLCVTVVGLCAAAAAAWGGWQWTVARTSSLVWVGAGVTLMCVLTLVRMAQVRSHVAGRVAAAVPASAAASAPSDVARDAPSVQDVSLDDDRAWTPRSLPRPLTSSAGSRAAATVDADAAREQLRQAAWDQPLRERAARQAPARLDAARGAQAEEDARIEAHVRQLLSRRAAG